MVPKKAVRNVKKAPVGSLAGVVLGPTSKKKMYVSAYIHRGHRPKSKKARWRDDLTVAEEFGLFEVADDGGWRCSRGHMWAPGEHEGARRLGTKAERLAKFPRNTSTAPWHGYPVSPRLDGSRGRPDDDLLEKWVADGVISRTFARRLQADRL